MKKYVPNDAECRAYLTSQGYESDESLAKCPCRKPEKHEVLRHCRSCHDIIDCWDPDERDLNPNDIYCAGDCWDREQIRRLTAERDNLLAEKRDILKNYEEKFRTMEGDREKLLAALRDIRQHVNAPLTPETSPLGNRLQWIFACADEALFEAVEKYQTSLRRAD